MGCRPRPVRTQPAALPATSKSTKLRAAGQPQKPCDCIINSKHEMNQQMPLDGPPRAFYSVPIFGTRLVPFAIPVRATLKTQPPARHLQNQQPSAPLACLINRAGNPASPDGGQHTT